ncbi:MAG: ADP-forming succinate--CoA ligase subunit beta [Prolixibacteraceae bacterium]|nr:ADP-forming succinate--CoA ligase subunit beta [Prolixibacteraceae bacterium]
MKIFEYQATGLFKKYGIPVTEGILCSSAEEVEAKIPDDGKSRVVKAQVYSGGRGKAGGVKVVTGKEATVEAAGQILGMKIKDFVVEKILITEAVTIEKEYYVGMVNDRNTRSVILMVSTEGGVDIEEVAAVSPSKIFRTAVDPVVGLMDWQARSAALKLFSEPDLLRQASGILSALYRLFRDTDSTLTEINPLVLTSGKKIVAVDGKMNFDDNALYRQPGILAMRETTDTEALEIEAEGKGLSYIKLNGTIGCIVNGAGLAMATMDMIKLYGGEPANFLDIGGSSNPQKVIDAMDLLIRDKNVKTVLINIFGGITRCDDVALGLIAALKKIQLAIPVVVRLSGTNAAEGLQIIRDYGLQPVTSMREAAKKAIELSKTKS